MTTLSQEVAKNQDDFCSLTAQYQVLRNNFLKQQADLAMVISETRGIISSIRSARIKNENKKLHIQCSQLETELAKITNVLQHDPLTGALNRRGMTETFKHEESTASRQKTPLSICMLDLDNFKLVNDIHGHLAGDLVLIHLVGVLNESLRPHDTIIRYGGEEFLIIMPNTTGKDGVDVMNRAQEALTNRGFTNKDTAISLSFSGGVAQWTKGESMLDLVSRADKKLYLAKHSGKKCIKGAAECGAEA
jgi:diguanylate cyclase